MQRRAAVAGVGESEFYKRGGSPHTEFQLACIAIRRAVEDAGLTLADVDGFVSYIDARNDPVRLSAALGIPRLEFSAQTWGGGGNGLGSAVALADMAVCAGYARHVVVFRALAQGQFSRYGQGGFGTQGGTRRVAGTPAFTLPYGLLTAAQINAMQTRRFMHEHGVTQDSLFEIAYVGYECAQRNPRALRRGAPLTREAYDASRWIVEPFHLYDCCPENDGAAAIVVTSTERARDLRRGAVPILAAAQGLEPRGGAGAFNEAPFPTAHMRHVGESLWRNAGVGPADIDVAQFYENFTGPVLMAIAEMGLCAADDLEGWVTSGALRWPHGTLPMNTSGGNFGEAYIHGFGLVTEAVRQIRGESTSQVDGAALSLVVGGPGYAPGSAVLFCRD
ncbi:MAG: acetyl-CoA acetyltransferase [Gammaproteobacteria bacterium]